ncbi:HAMP domain-containing sensor histidine kinase [Paenibacillus aurantius]|uniref:histidine kinase n=1 Tax=Paenibacillus aurantius TaxID=2918900 RepID=A0AA96LFU8_9BACL|nr:HAMP domain-containing sensor histidine kinase [Paenibacillus aurantius]WNQ12525.1 HAMP domain-containing sensor histidine kinase [Paenibacillus aurantius]
MGAAALLLVQAFAGDLVSRYHLDFSHGRNPFKAILKQEEAVHAEMIASALKDPDGFLGEPSRTEAWNSRLKAVNMGFVLLRNGEIAYVSPALGEAGVHDAFRFFQPSASFAGAFYLFDDFDFPYGDASRGTVYFLTDIGPLSVFLGKYSVLLLASLLGILFLGNGILTYAVFRIIVKPLQKLRAAANRIGQGKFDSAVRLGHDEIGGLFRTFDEMREQLKKAKETQLQYEENRKMLLSSISHDLKTPITSILGYVEGMSSGVADSPDKQERYMKTIQTKAKDMDALIDELFLFSKLDLGKVPFQFENVDLRAFLTDCGEEMDFMLGGGAISLELELPPAGPVTVSADREKLKRAVINLLDNAIKYMDKEKGRIAIRLKEEGEWALLEIEDNGQGIAAEELPHIFESFYRTDRSRNSQTGGSGLGLAIVREILEEHGAHLQASSQPGSGTSIHIRFRKAGRHA